MALSSTDFLASFDITDKTQEYDISPILLAALMMDTGLLGVIPMGSPAQDTTHYWTEIALNAGQVTVDGTGYNSAATAITLASGMGARLRGGELLKNLSSIPASGLPEVAQVTAVTAGSDAITVSRAYGGTTAVTVTFTANGVLDIVSSPLQEASDIQGDVTTVPSSANNFTQIFERSIKISRNQMKRPMASVADMLVQSIHDRTMELKRELEKTLWHSRKSASAGSDTVYRTMQGILQSLVGSNFNTVFSYNTGTTNFCAVIKGIVDAGAADDQSRLVLAGPTNIRQKVSAFDASNRRLVESDRRAGYYVEQVVSDLGVVVDVITSNYLGTVSPFTFAVLDVGRIKLCPFQDDAFKLMAAQDWVDGVKRRILGEFTVEVRNATTAHYAGYNVT